MKILAIIPARGGSKGIPRKNMQMLGGKPLIQYTVDAAKGCKEIGHIFISSDNDEIIEFCNSLGLDVTYKRPPHLATDEAAMIGVITDALNHLRSSGSVPESVLLLQPTSPFRNSRHISEAIRLFNENGANTLTSVHKMHEHPYECVKTEERGWTYLARPEKSSTRRQDYSDSYAFINGAIYLAKTEYLLAEKKFIEENETVLYFMEPESGIDIDEYSDLCYAEFLLKSANNKILEGIRLNEN